MKDGAHHAPKLPSWRGGLRPPDALARADDRKPFAQSALGSGRVAGMAGTAAPAVKVRAGLVIMKL